MAAAALAATALLLAGALLPSAGKNAQRRLVSREAWPAPTARPSHCPATPPKKLVSKRVSQPGSGRLSPQRNGSRCYHHSECYSDCCLVDWDFGGAFCAAKGGMATVCLPQTNGAVNIMCPCRTGLTCSTKDLMCPHRCYLI
ncbi:colipase-like protein 2 [Dipodomys spectabilis]|uniref:colipase-like protein 2 n=1 Tax=Dipodomys spectabilis TaxID=105255 RepID=UPI001C544C5B|nr:colipase-like protein 2 [Dipodomys spectabilis]